jgi:hypothetical protein
VLSLQIEDLADTNGLPEDNSFQVVWLRDGEEIEGQTAETYTLIEDDIDNTIQAQIRFTDQDGYSNALTASNSVEVVPFGDAPMTGSITLDGLLLVGQTLSIAEQNIADPDGIINKVVKWSIGDKVVNASNYTLLEEDLGQFVKVEVSYTDSFSNVTVLKLEPELPVISENTSPEGNLAISGNLFEGETLIVSDLGVVDSDGKTSSIASYQWFKVSSDQTQTLIEGITSNQYTLTQADVGFQILVKGSYTDGYGTVETVLSELSNPVVNVNNQPTGSLGLQGKPLVGDVLSPIIDLVDPDGFDFNTGTIFYKWFINDQQTDVDTPTYTLTESELGKVLHVEISYQDDLAEEGVLESVVSVKTSPVLQETDNVPEDAVVENGYYVVKSDGFEKPYLPSIATANQYIKNQFAKYEVDQPAQNALDAWIGKQGTIPTIASKKLSAGDQTVNSSGNDLLLLDFSDAEFGNKLTLQNEKVVAVKGNAGLVVDASADTAGIELVIDNNAKKVLTGSGNDKITGSQASDVIAAGTGTNNVDGGDGLDVLVFNGSKKDFTMTEGQVSKTGETTAYSNVEFLRFDDGLVTVSGNDWADNLIQDTWVLI